MRVTCNGENRPFEAVPDCEIATARPGDLLADVLSQAAGTARALLACAATTAADFRGGEVEKANAGLQEFTKGVGLLAATLTAVANAGDGAIVPAEWNGQPLTSHAQSLVRPLTAMVEAYESRDWLTLADILEFDAQPTLEPWPAMFDSLNQPHAQA